MEKGGTITIHTSKYWYIKLNEGDTSLEHNEIPGRPLIGADSDAILNAVETNTSTTTRRILDKLGISQTYVI